ncbi:MAG: hypothetical protein ACK4K7_05390 [Allosphingosinicella sp.]|uniref:hypothetical protein n=1 Tax=Allosphingosinicella sp. TaxID=2823234 RepID=UPI003952A693
MANGGNPTERSFLHDLSRELASASARLAAYADEEARRREEEALPPITATQLRALLAARHARSTAFGTDLVHPGWSLLLELFRAQLEERPARVARLTAEARVPPTTALRWIDRLVSEGLVQRDPHLVAGGGSHLSLTDKGRDAMEDYFVSVQLGWSAAGAPE